MNYRKVTEDMKVQIRTMKDNGVTNMKIAEKLGIGASTVSYHSSEGYKKLAIERAIKNERVRDRANYFKGYNLKRYNEDEEYREKVKKRNRDNWRKKHGKGNNLS